jgi:hypothetical protein
MPRIMSRNHSLYRPRSTFGNSSKSSALSVRDEPDSAFDVAFRWLSLSNESSRTSSPSSSVGSSPSTSLGRMRQGRMQNWSQRDHHRRQSENDADEAMSEDRSDSWGQFVNTAEAEEESIRHSKILSKRYSIN